MQWLKSLDIVVPGWTALTLWGGRIECDFEQARQWIADSTVHGKYIENS